MQYGVKSSFTGLKQNVRHPIVLSEWTETLPVTQHRMMFRNNEDVFYKPFNK